MCRLNFKTRLVFIAMILAILALVFMVSFGENPKFKDGNQVKSPMISLHRTATDEVEILELEDVVLGVLAGEMSAGCEVEALKAQGVAARSYILKKHLAGKEICDDPSCCQIYLDKVQRQEKWGSDYKIYEEKLQNVVEETAGEVMMQDGEIVDCFYSANCGGQTESATACWGGMEDYTSVECFWCTKSSSHQSTIFIDKIDMASILEVDYEALPMLKIASTDKSGRVKMVTCGDGSWSGAEFRQLLGLKSQQFSWLATEQGYFFTVQGYGHGVGLCQDGTAEMAKNGYNYKEILEYYYNSCQVSSFLEN